MLRIFVLLFAFLALPLKAEEIVAGLSQGRVSITTNFDGSDILVYGAVKRDAPLPKGDIDIVIAISGPSSPLTVRKKDKRFGIWVNTESVDVGAAPAFYAVATTGPLAEILSPEQDQQHRISIEQMIRSVGVDNSRDDIRDALIRIRASGDLYQELENTVEFTADTLFRTDIALPANLTEGTYHTRMFILRDKAVVSQTDTVIDVRKVGLERFLYNLAHDLPLVYGLLSLFIAIAAGWGASTIFRYIK